MVLFFRRFLIGFIISVITLSSAQGKTVYVESDQREKLPPVLNNTYIGFAEAYSTIPFSNHDLNFYQADSFQNNAYSSMVLIGHYYTRYLAAGINLLCRPNAGIKILSKLYRVHFSIFDFSLRPTLPLTKHFMMYGVGGIGTISRSGFSVNNRTVVSSENLPAFLTGAGVIYSFTPNWNLLAGIEYIPQINQKQPRITFAYAGLYYLFRESNLSIHYPEYYIFHKHLIQMGGFSRSIVNPPDFNTYFTCKGYIPIFWDSRVALRNGAWIRYDRNVFHTHKIFSFDWGVSFSTYHSKMNNNLFAAFSVYPLLRFWFLHSQFIDLYFSYSAAGPTVLTRRIIDNADMGGHFIFQDLMGFGGFFGKNKHFNLNVKIGHYSNGNLFPRNPGLDVPITLTIGYAFS